MDKARLSEIARPAALYRPLPGSAGAAEWQHRARLDDPLSQPRLDRTAANGPAREGMKCVARATCIVLASEAKPPFSPVILRCELRSAFALRGEPRRMNGHDAAGPSPFEARRRGEHLRVTGDRVPYVPASRRCQLPVQRAIN